MRWRVERGIEIGRPSVLDLEADRNGAARTAVRAGGAAIMMSEGVFTLS